MVKIQLPYRAVATCILFDACHAWYSWITLLWYNPYTNHNSYPNTTLLSLSSSEDCITCIYVTVYISYIAKKDLTLHRGSYMSALMFLLNLLYEIGKRDKMRDLPSISLSQRVK